MGPLEVSEIKADGCTLTWRKPETDGGSPITGYTVERKSVNRVIEKGTKLHLLHNNFQKVDLQCFKNAFFRMFGSPVAASRENKSP